MYDPELSLKLLKEMSEAVDGRISNISHLGMTEEQRHVRHQLEILTDLGHAQWEGEQLSRVRITGEGYDFLNAIEKNPNLKKEFLSMLGRGLPYLKAVAAILAMV